MKVAVFGTKPYDREYLDAANGAVPDIGAANPAEIVTPTAPGASAAPTAPRHTFTYLRPRLDAATAPLAEGHEAVCVFVNDRLDAAALEVLARGGVRMIALRCAGFNNVDLAAAERLGFVAGRVPAYSPRAVAEHAIGLILALNRRLHRAFNRVREGNFELDGLLGFDLYGRTAGVVGTGQIGAAAARILLGFGMRVRAYDIYENAELVAAGVTYVPLDTLLAESDVVTLHAPLTPQTHHMIDARALASMKPGAMLVNTSRGALLDTAAAVDALKSRRLGALALDVYEGEAELFFQDRSGEVLEDDMFARLLTFPNVLVTAHQAFFTRDALQGIASATLANLDGFERAGAEGIPAANRVLPRPAA